MGIKGMSERAGVRSAHYFCWLFFLVDLLVFFLHLAPELFYLCDLHS